MKPKDAFIECCKVIGAVLVIVAYAIGITILGLKIFPNRLVALCAIFGVTIVICGIVLFIELLNE